MIQRYRVKDFYRDDAIWRYNFYKIMGLTLIAIPLLMFLLTGFATAPTLNPPGEQLESAVTLSGTGSPGRIVEISADGALIGRAVPAANGSWTYTTSDRFPAGEYGLSTAAVAQRRGGDRIELAQGLSGNLTTYALPQFTLPGSEQEIGEIEINGSGSAGSQIQLTIDGQPVGQPVPVDPNGNWSQTADFPSDGRFEIGAQLLDSQGNQLGQTPNRSLSIAAPIVLAPLATAGAIALGDFELGNDDLAIGPISLSGSGEPGTTVKLLIDDSEVAETTVDADGNWAFNLIPQPLALGDHSYLVVMLGPDGAELDRTSSQTLTLAEADLVATAAAPLTIDSDLGLNDFVLNDDDLANGNLSWSGSGQPGATIRLLANGDELLETEVDADGKWAFDDAVALPLGPYDFIVTMTLPESDLAQTSDVTRAELNTETVAAQVDQVDNDVPANDGPLFVRIENISNRASALDEVMLQGSAPPNAEVIFAIDDTPFGSATADENGDWELIAYYPNRSITVTAEVSRGDQSADDAVSFDLSGPRYGYAFQSSGNGAILVDDGFLRAAFEASGSNRPLTLVNRAPAVELILDASWSMTLPVDSNDVDDRLSADDPNSRIAIAKEEVLDLVDNLIPEGTPFALRAFGNILGDFACNDNNLMIPLQPFDRDAVSTIVSGIEPQENANTPLGGALLRIPSDLARIAPGQRAIVILLTDGDENCGRDPAAIISEISESGFEIVLNIIGFSVDPDLGEKLEEWATLGNGVYFEANDAGQLSEALLALYPQRFDIIDSGGTTIVSGLTDGIPVELEPGLYTVSLTAGGEIVSKTVVVLPDSITAVVTE